jgi:hypothetical protein
LKQTAARPKSGRPLQTPLPARQDGFAEAVPFRVFRDGTGILTLTRSHFMEISFLSPNDPNVLKMVIDLIRARKLKTALISGEFRYS